MTDKFLSRDTILGTDDLPRREVEVPEWGGTVLIRMLTVGERDLWETSVGTRRQPYIRASMVAKVLIDETGKRLFDDSEIEKLAAKSSKAVDRIYEAAAELNGLRDQDVEELEKNS